MEKMGKNEARQPRIDWTRELFVRSLKKEMAKPLNMGYISYINFLWPL